MTTDVEDDLIKLSDEAKRDAVTDEKRFESVRYRGRRIEEATVRRVRGLNAFLRVKLGVVPEAELPNRDAGVGYSPYAKGMMAIWEIIAAHDGRPDKVLVAVKQNQWAWQTVYSLTGLSISVESIAAATRNKLFQAFKADILHLRVLADEWNAQEALKDITARSIVRESRYDQAIAENEALRDAEQAAWSEEMGKQGDVGSKDLTDALRVAGFDEAQKE